MRVQYADDALTEVSKQADRLTEAFQNRYNAHLDFAIQMARLSPAFALNKAVLGLGGTGVERHARFREAFDRAKIQLRDFYWKEIGRRGFSRADRQKYGEWSMGEIPRLDYRDAWPDAEVTSALLKMMVIVIWGLVFFAGAYVSLLRFDVR